MEVLGDHSFFGQHKKKNSWSFPDGAAKAHWSFCSTSCIRSSGLLHRCFSKSVAFRNSSSNEATKLFLPRLRSSAPPQTWRCPRCRCIEWSSLRLRRQTTVSRCRNFLKSVIGFYPPTQILMFYGLGIIPYIYGRPLRWCCTYHRKCIHLLWTCRGSYRRMHRESLHRRRSPSSCEFLWNTRQCLDEMERQGEEKDWKN